MYILFSGTGFKLSDDKNEILISANFTEDTNETRLDWLLVLLLLETLAVHHQ